MAHHSEDRNPEVATAVGGVRSPWIDRTIILLILSLHGALAVHWEPRWRPGFDEWWHIVIAGQQPFSAAVSEWRGDSHPPLHYLLLRPLVHASTFVVRMPGVLATLLSILLVHSMAGRAGLSRGLRLGVALLYATAPATVATGLQVRSYAFLLLTVLAAWLCLMNAIAEWPCEARSGNPRSRSRWFIAFLILGGAMAPWFAGAGILAFAGSVLAISLLAILSRDARSGFLRDLRSTPLLVWSLLLGSAGAFIFWLKWSTQPAVHLWLQAFLPDKHRLAPWWWLRHAGEQWRLFVPWPRSTLGGVLAGLSVTLVAFLAISEIRKKRMLRALPLGLWVALIGIIALAAFAGRYPFGGHLRHQILLLPLYYLTAAILIQTLRVPGSGALLFAVAVLLSVAQVASFTPAPGPDEFHPTELWIEDALVLSPLLQESDLVLCDAYTHVGLASFALREGSPLLHQGRGEFPTGATFDLYLWPRESGSVHVVRLSKVWKWGRLDLPASIERITEHHRVHPTSTAWFYVREPDPSDGGGIQDVPTRTFFAAWLEIGRLTLTTRIELSGAWLAGVVRARDR